MIMQATSALLTMVRWAAEFVAVAPVALVALAAQNGAEASAANPCIYP